MVTERFPRDQLARAALADNATSVASAEADPLRRDGFAPLFVSNRGVPGG